MVDVPAKLTRTSEIVWNAFPALPPQDGTRLLAQISEGGIVRPAYIDEDGEWSYDNRPELRGKTPRWWALLPKIEW
ncbi:MAG: hypothetical protein AAF346_00085 [Pseudomonadota bacterium]